MGIFDTVVGKFFCPFCSGKIEDFQTKELDPLMNVYEFIQSNKPSREEIEMHTKCDKCERWISINVYKSNLKLVKGAVPREI